MMFPQVLVVLVSFALLQHHGVFSQVTIFYHKSQILPLTFTKKIENMLIIKLYYLYHLNF